MPIGDVVEGKILSPTISETRQEEDFLRHIQQTVQNQPDVKGWRIITDNLNTHQSESLVVWVASLQGIQEQELGIKGKKGILKSMESRAAFLQQNEHFVHFMYTPKHCSWLNQIEIWFGILARKVIRKGSFKSKQELAERLMQFIQYFNAVLSKPFKWNYGGKPCRS